MILILVYLICLALIDVVYQILFKFGTVSCNDVLQTRANCSTASNNVAFFTRSLMKISFSQEEFNFFVKSWHILGQRSGNFLESRP